MTGAAALGMAFPACNPANAAIITTLSGSPVAVSGGFAYTYSATLSDGQEIDPRVTPAFGTVYDFGPIIGSITSTGLLNSFFTFSTNLTDPAAYKTAPDDNPGLANIRFTDTTVPVLINSLLGTFTVVSPFGPNTIFASADGQAVNAANHQKLGNVSSVLVPAPVPVPAALPLFGTGLAFLGYLTRKRKRAAHPFAITEAG